MGSGVVAAAQIGKAIISVPMIRSDLALGLDLAGLIVATFATLGAMTGIGAGLVVGRFGARAIVDRWNGRHRARQRDRGQCARSACSAGGAHHRRGRLPGCRPRDPEHARATGHAREAGFRDGRLERVHADRHHADAVGRAAVADDRLAQLLARERIGDRLVRDPAGDPCAGDAGRRRAPGGPLFADALTIVRQPSCLVLAFAFFAYSCQIFSLAFALPLLLTSAHGVSLGAAGLLSAMVLAVSAIGHLSSGFLLRAGVPIWANVAAAFGFFALSGFAVYGNVLPPQGISLVAALALGMGGLAPGAIYAAAPHAAPAPAAVPPTIGLVQQASSLGQFAGPLVLGLWVEHLGWQAAPAILAPAALPGSPPHSCFDAS